MSNPLRPTCLLRKLARAGLPLLLALAGATDGLAADAGASVGDVTVTFSGASPADGIWPWAVTANWFPQNIDVELAAGLTANVATTTAWTGAPLSASATNGSTALASASVSGGALNPMPASDGTTGTSTGSATASATDGDGASAVASIFTGKVLAGAGTTLTVTSTVSDLWAHADGGFASALVSLQIAGPNGSDPASDQAWIFDSADFSSANGEEFLTVTWTNASSDAAYADLWITASAQAIGATAVPEPASSGLLVAGVTVLGLLARRRRAP